jgi:hypothetical protein
MVQDVSPGEKPGFLPIILPEKLSLSPQLPGFLGFIENGARC